MDNVVVYHLEDEFSLRTIIKTYVNYLASDIELVQFENSDHMMAALAKSLPTVDLFLLDIRVPGERNGQEVAERLRQLNYRGPIVITSAYDVPKREWLRKWKCDWLIKPTDAIELRKQLIPLARAYHKSKKATPR